MLEDRMACKGAPTIQHGDMEECVACGDRVQWNFVDHPLFGFKAGCSYCKENNVEARNG